MDNIDLVALEGVICRYQARMADTRAQEIYKWEAVKRFSEAYNPEAEDVGGMLGGALDESYNLLVGQSWFPVGMLKIFANENPSSTISALETLFDESLELKKRMFDYEAWASLALEKHNVKAITAGESAAKNHFQDTRSMSAYLAFRHPESHYLYKANMFREAAKVLGVECPGNKYDKVIAYRKMCDQILSAIEESHFDLIEESDALLGDLVQYDPNHHMLVQDIVFFITSYDKDEALLSENADPLGDNSSEMHLADDDFDDDIEKQFVKWSIEANNHQETYANQNRRILSKQSTEAALMDEYLPQYESAFLCSNRSEIEEAYNRAIVSPKNRDYHYRVSAALKIYLKFLDWMKEQVDEQPKSQVTLDDSCGHWLLVANAKIWSFFGLEVGAKTSYTIYNDKGNPRRIHKNYLSAKPGDPIIGYESSPTRRVVALCEITREHDDERLYFHKVRDIEGGLTFDQIKTDQVLSGCEFSKNPNGSFFYLTDEEYARFVELLGLEGEEEEDDNPVAPAADAAECEAYTDEDFLKEVYVPKEGLDDMRGLLECKRNLILQGSPGTGKTFCAKRLAWAMMGCKDDSRITSVQFHQSTAYDDFVCGFRPDGNGGFIVKDGPFVRACRDASADPERPHFVIIDEINRANISKVLGELLMLIEADHREVDSVLLTVSDKRLTVPRNLFIIGMMNTADRGLALIDYALRRRFAFFEMEPALSHPRFLEELGEEGDPALAALAKAVEEVNADIASDPALGAGFRIGHSYFCGGRDARLVFRYELKPLVEEYWFDDRKKAAEELAKLEAALQ